MSTQSTTKQVRHKRVQLPPTPPETDNSSDNQSSSSKSCDGNDTDIPLPPASSPPTKVLSVDRNTPDRWIPRDPRLIRLTGVHPFNVEPPLSDLFDEGFLTSPELFFVRNHGYVPKVPDEDLTNWEFTVEGMVKHPFKLTLKDLLKLYESKTYPVTLVCAGNRRKEQNVVRKTKGFSWGAAGVSTALFTGVVMADLLKTASPMRGARYVCMEGADKLPNGCYGTSVKLNSALDPNKGMMLAYKMNGEMLQPDHGRPLRAVIPGQIGGRSVKWLKRLIITSEPSDNWYHIYDNRVLPTMVSPEESTNNPRWWTDERYAIHDLGTNSATAYPEHGEQLALIGAPEFYRVKGYAYAGGGRRVTRVELTLDKGKTWRLANIDYAEDQYREAGPRELFGGTLDMEWRETCFCWCLWDLDLPVSALADAQDICVRAMDESMNVQPRDMYWSVLGMMNNPWYRVTISRGKDSLSFEHPTQPALLPGGWMERVKKAGGDLSNGFWGEKIGLRAEEENGKGTESVNEIVMVKAGLHRTITLDELRKHDGEDSPWFVVGGEVYDGTPFLEAHPGGKQSIVSAAALDSTDEFMAIHSETAKEMMRDYHIGSLDDDGRSALADDTIRADSELAPAATFLESRIWKKAVLHAKTIVSWDTRIFTYKLDHEFQTLGLPIGQHLMMRLQHPLTKEAIIRSYTPISSTAKQGLVDILIKVYFDTKEKKGGKMSQAMDALPLGRHVDFKGPIGKFEYLGKGICAVNGKRKNIKTFLMICAGSGITPIYQVLQAVMRDRNDETRCVVLDGNRSFEDILCKAELDAFAKDPQAKCEMICTLTKAPDDWTGLRGRIDAPLLKKHAERKAYGGGDEAMALICGPEALEESVRKTLLDIDWRDEELLFF